MFPIGSFPGLMKVVVSRRVRASVALVMSLLMTLAPTVSFAQTPVPARVFQNDILEAFVPGPLTWVRIPEPGNLSLFVANRAAAVRLGKALFWDMSVGSTGTQACATCHFHAGVDARDRNQGHPGANAIFEVGGANHQAALADLPFTTFADPDNRFSARTRSNLDDVFGSQGVPFSAYKAITPGNPVDSTTPLADGVFNAPDAGGMALNTRRVTGRNTPSAINAVFNLRNFWDGRAAMAFNGVTPFGQHDPAAKVWTVGTTGVPTQVSIQLDLSSLASQAVGPVLNDVEMSATGRNWTDVGRKLLPMQPLMQQAVSPADSVLGGMAASGAGLTGTYADMVRAAFQPAWWNSTTPVTVNGGSYSVMEANFSLFFGLAIQMYESTLVSDNAKFDQVRRGDVLPDGTVARLTANELRGLEIFTNIGQNTNPDTPVGFCAICHLGPEFTGAAVSQVGLGGLALPGLPVAPEFLVERMQSGAGLALARLVMSTNPLPDQLPFPAGFNLNPDTSPLTLTIQVRPHAGDPTASGTYKNAFGKKLTQPAVTALGLEPNPQTPTSPAVTATLTVGRDGSIGLEVSTFNLVPGVYDVLAGNVVLGTLTSVPNVVYDLGFYNVGATPTVDDMGLGGSVNPDGLPVSLSKQRIMGLPEPFIRAGVPTVIDPVTGLPMTIVAPIATDTPLINGTFKVPSLRNAELTAPYFHNGGKRTLCDVVDFYNRGGDFHAENAQDIAPLIQNLGMTARDKADVVAFLLTLTDNRVRNQQAPFDHPQLFIPNGHTAAGGLAPDAQVLDANGDGVADDNWLELPAVGAAGGPTLQDFLGGGVGACLVTTPDTTAPVVTAPASATVAAVDGTGTPVTSVAIQTFLGSATASDNVGVTSFTNNAPARFPLGVTLVTFTATDAAGNTGTASASVTVADQTQPLVTPPVSITVTGTDATGIASTNPAVAAFLAGATATDNVGVTNLTNNAPAQLPTGVTTVTFTATDAAGNTGTASASVTVIDPTLPTDTTLPVVTAPAAVTVAAVNGSGTPVTNAAIQTFLGGATATDNVGVTSLTNNAPAQFPLNVATLVTFTASDAAGNTGTASSTVTVTDQTQPVVTPPASITVVSSTAVAVSDPAIQAFLGGVKATDNVGVSGAIQNNAPLSFPPGVTTVTFTAADAAGNTGTASTTVTVAAQTNTPLHDAVWAGDKAKVESLIAGGASPDAIGVDGRTPLHLGAIKNNKEIVGILLKTVKKINGTDNFGHTALFYATNAEVRKLLLSYGAISL